MKTEAGREMRCSGGQVFKIVAAESNFLLLFGPISMAKGGREGPLTSWEVLVAFSFFAADPISPPLLPNSRHGEAGKGSEGEG